MKSACQDCKHFLRHYYKLRNPFSRRYDRYISLSVGHCRYAADTAIEESHPICGRFEPVEPEE